MLIRRRRAGIITLTRGVRRFPKLAPGLPLPLQRACQLRVVAVHVPYALLDLPLVDNEAMKQRNMEERLTVLVLVCLTVVMITASALTHSLITASFGLPFIPSLYLFLETPSISRRRRFENERGMGESRRRSSKTNRRLRRLEKTVESLSHGMILALTQLRSGDMHADTELPRRGSDLGPHHRPSGSNVVNDEIESVSGDGDGDDGYNLSTTFTGLGLSENGAESFIFLRLVLDSPCVCAQCAAGSLRPHHRPIIPSRLPLLKRTCFEYFVKYRRRQRHLLLPR
jgi:hypothetical protein